MSDGIVIAGGGLAAQRCVETLRSRGHAGPIRIACAEPDPPYDRPPLSKEVLAGAADGRDLAFRPQPWYAAERIDLLLGDPAVRLDPSGRRVLLGSGRVLAYDRLLVATGAAPRLPDAWRRTNVHVLRTRAEAETLRAGLLPGARVAIIGAGFIGQEVAAAARRHGADVTLVEALPAPLHPVLGAEIGGWLADLHRAEGVDVRCGVPVAGLQGTGTATAVALADGSELPCDLVVVGIGVEPDTAWLASSGLPARGGIPTDPAGRTALPGVFAAGDAASPFDPVRGAHRRSEHWEAAVHSGRAAARAMLGLDIGPAASSAFWSDQYGTRIQYVGDARGHDAVEIDGDPGARDATAVFLRAGMPVAALLVGRPRALPAWRRAVAPPSVHPQIRRAA